MTPSLSSPRERRSYIVALMLISGLSKAECARRLGYSTSTIDRLADRPDFRELYTELQREVRESTLGTLLDNIDREAMPTLQTLLNLRDGNFEDPQRARVQADVGKFILGDLHMDRRFPKINQQQTDGVLHIRFDQQMMRHMGTVLADADNLDAIEVEAYEPARIALPLDPTIPRDDIPTRDSTKGMCGLPKKVRRPIPAQPINEVIDELRDEEEWERGHFEY